MDDKKKDDNDNDNDNDNNNINNKKELNLENDSDENSENSDKNSLEHILSSKGATLNINNKLERINENFDENFYTNMPKDKVDADEELKGDPQEIISKLRNKIIELENRLIDLKDKNEELTKNNIQNKSIMKRMSFVGIRRNFSFSNKTLDDNIKYAALLKEKNDLQEINEKMLNMLTDKELEIEELQENFDKYKSDIKNEIKQYLEKIDELEDKLEIMEENSKNQENLDDNLDKLTSEYNKYKIRMENTLKEYINKEEELKTELENKENTIRKMKNDMQNLEIENIQLQNQTEQRQKAHDADLVNIDKIIFENNKLKADINMWEEKIKTNEQKTQMIIASKDEEIKKLNEDLDFNNKNLLQIKEEKNKEITTLKNEITKCNRDINNLVKKNELIEKEDKNLKENNSILQSKLDKKIKELQEINDSAKKLIENKENLIQEYEVKLNDLYQDKNKLIEQNHELLDKVKNMNTNNLGDILNDEEENDINDSDENKLLISEIKNLKEQLEKQAADLVSLNAMEKEVSRLNSENEKLTNDYKALKEKINRQKYEENADDLMNSIKEFHKNQRNNKTLRHSSTKIKDIPFANRKNLEKQIDALKQIKEDEKKNFENEIDKLKGDIAVWKVKYLNQELENETMIVKYKNIIKSINEQCKKKGIKLNFNINI